MLRRPRRNRAAARLARDTDPSGPDRVGDCHVHHRTPGGFKEPLRHEWQRNLAWRAVMAFGLGMIPFTGNPLNRAAEKRGDAQWLAAARRDPNSFILPFWNLQVFLTGTEDTPELGLLRPGLAENLAAPDAALVFLGLEKGRALFALDISAAADPTMIGPLAGLGQFVEARAAAMMLPLPDAGILAQAKSMLDWHMRHQFCARCGGPSLLADGGYKRVCWHCAAEHFPRTDPVVIMLALHEDHCLVGRGVQFPRGMYSALAGFVEPGETIEDAVRRELFEETGIEVGDVRYLMSQPWPFPSSLMIGCLAQAKGRNLTIDPTEIAEARWLPRSLVAEILDGAVPSDIHLPKPIAIAHHLMRAWLKDGPG